MQVNFWQLTGIFIVSSVSGLQVAQFFCTTSGAEPVPLATEEAAAGAGKGKAGAVDGEKDDACGTREVDDDNFQRKL